MNRFVLLGLLLGCVVSGSAQELRDTLHTYFRSSSVRVDTLYMQNNESLSSFFDRNLDRLSNPTHELKMVKVVGSCSPEGTINYNEALALKRARSLADYLMQHLPLAEDLMEVTSVGVDWSGLTDLVLQKMEVPNREEVLAVLQKDYSHNERLSRLKQVDRSIPYRWMYKHLFPLLRQSRVIVYYEEKQPVPQPVPQKEPVVEAKEDVIVTEEPQMPEAILEKKPFYWALKTNGLYDLALIPNIGVEVYVGQQWSVAANWMYAWWSNTGKDNFWRIYGGDVEVRRWFGKKAAEKPLQGHHLGVYGQLLTYDFELGDRGYMADKWNYAFGVSYGYSLPIAKRLNLDFTLGIGYWGGRYKEYLPVEGHYVWQSTKNRRWFGPTKAEVSLVWLLGHGNENKQKGGRQ